MSCPALRAVIFDFNGVIADDETPHRPEIDRHTLDRLNEIRWPSEPPLRSDEGLVIEDSLAGIKAALAPG